jgi:hypothetical protein
MKISVKVFVVLIFVAIFCLTAEAGFDFSDRKSIFSAFRTMEDPLARRLLKSTIKAHFRGQRETKKKEMEQQRAADAKKTATEAVNGGGVGIFQRVIHGFRSGMTGKEATQQPQQASRWGKVVPDSRGSPNGRAPPMPVGVNSENLNGGYRPGGRIPNNAASAAYHEAVYGGYQSQRQYSPVYDRSL